MAEGEGRRGRGTPSSHLKDHLGLISQFPQQAQAGLEKESDTARIFMAIYSGFLVEAGARIRWLLEPSVIEQSTVAIRRVAPAITGAERDLATRLLAIVWTAGVVAGVDTEDWMRSAPELPGICLRMAAQVTEGEDAGPSQ